MDAPVATDGREHAEGDDCADGRNHSKATPRVKRLRFPYERPGRSRFDKAALTRYAKSVRHTARTVVPVPTFSVFGERNRRPATTRMKGGGERGEEGGGRGTTSQRLAWRRA